MVDPFRDPFRLNNAWPIYSPELINEFGNKPSYEITEEDLDPEMQKPIWHVGL